MSRIHYYQRIFSSYLLKKNSQLTFWHEEPEINPAAFGSGVGPYYMKFARKARYEGPFNDSGIPLLDYHGKVGRQYNPIAIAQYALGNYNLAVNGETERLEIFLKNAQWLLNNRMANKNGVLLWPHHFDFEYFKPLKAPWFSGLAQGQGLSVLIRAYDVTKDQRYLDAAEETFRSLTLSIEDGGVLFRDLHGLPWIEEYLVDPPTHILNGCIWALWGIYDYGLLTQSDNAMQLFAACAATIAANLHKYDNGFWSLYELTPQRFKSVASKYYHHLHIVQLRVMHRLTGDDLFRAYADKWCGYGDRAINCTAARLFKIVFKMMYY